LRPAATLAGVVLCLLASVTKPSAAAAQNIMYDAVTHDSVALFAFEPMQLASGDTALLLPYRTFLPAADTVAARKEALGWWPFVSAHVKTRGYPYAIILAIWAGRPTDSLLQGEPAATFKLWFARDPAGCWHLLGDTTEVSTCSPLSR
jgi:hypothetical protein